MLPLTLLTLGVIGQIGKVEVPTMQFTNLTQGSVSVYIYCKDDKSWENNKRPLVIRVGATAAVTLREGNFQVVARNQQGLEQRNSRTLAARELDWMDIKSMRDKAAPFKIVDHGKSQ